MRRMGSIIISAVYLCMFMSYQINCQSYSPEENQKIKTLLAMTENILDKEYMKTESYLIRFLQANNMNVDVTKTKLQEVMKWRLDNKVHDIINETPNKEFVKNEFLSLDSVDKKGRPILMIDMKKLDVRKYALGGMGKQYQRIWTQSFERVEDKIHSIANISATDRKVIMMSDLQNFNLRIHGCLPCLQLDFDAISSYESHYPGLIESIIAVNAPRAFPPFLEILKPFMSARTKSIINIYTGDKTKWQPLIYKVVDRDQLPINLGGTKARN